MCTCVDVLSTDLSHHWWYHNKSKQSRYRCFPAQTQHSSPLWIRTTGNNFLWGTFFLPSTNHSYRLRYIIVSIIKCTPLFIQAYLVLSRWRFLHSKRITFSDFEEICLSSYSFKELRVFFCHPVSQLHCVVFTGCVRWKAKIHAPYKPLGCRIKPFGRMNVKNCKASLTSELKIHDQFSYIVQ